MDLQTFITEQEAQQAVTRIAVPVDPQLEIAAICRREFAKPQNSLLVFEKVTGSRLPLAANLFGTARRTAQLLGCRSLEQFSERCAKILHNHSGSATQRLNTADKLQYPQQQSLRCQQVIAPLDLARLPAIRSWPGEGKPYLTLGLLISKHPLTGRLNLGLYRAQILGADKIAINCSPGSGAAKHLEAAKQQQQALPVSLIFGGDPAWLWAAAAPLPDSCDEFAFCQQLLQTEYRFGSGLSQPLPIPDLAELVIEGQIDPGATCLEGPFGNHSGSYVSREDCPLLQVTAITHRQDPILPITVVGPPPSENIHLARASEVLLRQMLRIDYPQIRDLQMPTETIFHGVALLAVETQSAAGNRELIDQLWKQSPLRRSRLLILLDADIDLSSLAQGWWRTINQLDHQKLYQDAGRIAIDATGVDPAGLVIEDQQTIDLLNRRSKEYNL